MEIFLGNNKYLVEGSKNAAIYDLEKQKVYELNEMGKIAIRKYCDNIELDEIQQKFINDLICKKLISPMNINKSVNFKKPKYKINFAWLELNSICNLKCIHCYGSFGCEKKPCHDSMTLNDWKNAVDELYDEGCRHIQLIGGEPLCFPNCDELIKYIKNKGINQITIFTNATLINSKNIKVIKDNNVKVRFSLYGHNPTVHDNITQVKGSFDKTINAITLLKKNNVKVSVAVVIMKENENYIEDIKNFVTDKLNIKYNGFDVIRPSCVNDNLEHRIDNYDILSKRYYTKPRFSITQEQFINNHFFNPCLNHKIAITSNGDIIPCIFARDFIAGNIKESGLKNIKKNIEMQWSINKNQITECKECEYRYACSDCRPLAIGVNGNKLSKYPRCCYSPQEGIWKDIIDITKEIIK